MILYAKSPWRTGDLEDVPRFRRIGKRISRIHNSVAVLHVYLRNSLDGCM